MVRSCLGGGANVALFVIKNAKTLETEFKLDLFGTHTYGSTGGIAELF